MVLLPSSVVNRLLPALTALQRSPLGGMLREPVFDYYAGWLHPQLTLRRVFAKVLAKCQQGSDTLALTLATSRHWLGARAGQHLPLTVEIDGVRHTRYYSPCASATRGGRLEIAIRRNVGGLVSNWLHDRLAVGDYVELGQAGGDFGLPARHERPALLLAAGSGITPILAMARELASQSAPPPLALFYYGRRRAELAYLDTLQALFATQPHWRLQVVLTGEAAGPDELAGRIAPAQLAGLGSLADWQAVACGSFGFVEAARAALDALGGVASLAVEAFSPPVFAGGEAQPVALHYRRSGRQQAGTGAATLLAQAEAHGLRPANGCRMGICNTCTCTKLSGQVRDLQTGQVSAEPNQSIRLCMTAAIGEVVLDL